MKRPLEMESGIGAFDPCHFRAEWLESGQADNYALAGIDHFNELDPASLGRYVHRRKLEAEAAELFHADLIFQGAAAALTAAALRPGRRFLSGKCARRNRGWGRCGGSSRPVRIHPQRHAL